MLISGAVHNKLIQYRDTGANQKNLGESKNLLPSTVSEAIGCAGHKLLNAFDAKVWIFRITPLKTNIAHENPHLSW